MKQKILIIVSLFMACVGMQAQTEKFYLGVTDKDGKTVAGTIYDDFTFEITTPAAGTALNSKQATINVRMTNVPSLKIEGTHSATKTFTTTVDKNAVFSEYLSALYFNGTINNPVTVAEVGDFEYPLTPGNTIGKKDFKYTITGAGGTITGEPNSAAAAQAAWDFLTATSHMTASSKSDPDTYLYLMQNAYVQLGNQRHVFNLPEGYKFMKGNFELNIDKVKEGEAASIIQTIDPAPATVAESYLFSVYLPAGSEIAIGTKFVTLNKDCMIYVDASKIPGEPELIEGRIKQFRDDLRDESKNILLTSIELINELLGYAVEAGQTSLPVVVEFKTEPMDLVYYAGTSTEVDVTTKTWATVQAQYPNAVAYVRESNTNHDALAEWAQTQTNVVVEYAAGKKGMYYKCPEFVLTDPTKLTNPAKADFYTPKKFYAVTGSYKRPMKKYDMACLPFALSGSMFSSSAKLYTFACLKGTTNATAYFNICSNIEAGTPCVIVDNASTWNEITFDNTEIYPNPDNANNLKGTYVYSDQFKDGTYYRSTTAGKVQKFNGNLYPFRSCLSFEGSTMSGAKTVNIVWDDDLTTSIDTKSIESNDVENIYSPDGIQLRRTVKGLNIVKTQDGIVRKVFVK